MSAADVRAEPDALLAEAEREGRGRLKVYLGMAPGVGKTYAMLEGARRLASQGVDVVAGIVETHGRAETLALAQGIETLPRRRIAYRGQALEEFDLDAALARRPGVLLLDELAHTNAPESRHPKRWQDAEELVRAGIDVHTTLNVQHLESLADVVARITGVRVAETVPDAVLERAAEIELIDLTPEELLARLAEGKVYAPHLAGRARESFFKPGNLTALRELALRRAAERVDDQLVGYMRAHAIEGPWAAGERILALVGPDGLGPAVVRAANRIADQLRAPFVAVTVEAAGRLPSPAGDASVAEALALAGRLGGRVERLVATDLVDEILRFARKGNFTQIFVGRSRSAWWREALRRSLVGALVRRADGVAIHVVSESRPAPRSGSTAERLEWRRALPYAAGLAAVAGVVGLATIVRDLATTANVAMLFLGAVIFVAVRFGARPALAASVAAFLAYNFFFTEPVYTLNVEHWHDLIALAVFVVVAGVTGTLAGRVRAQALAGRERIAALGTLYDFARRLGAASTLDDLMHAVVLQAHRLVGSPAIALLPDGDDLAERYAWPPDEALGDGDRAAARWALAHAEPAGRGTGTLPSSAWHFRPMRTAKRALGVLCVKADRAPEGDAARTLDAVLDQAAVALERIALEAQAAQAAALAETDRLRSALLSSVSHDLRTPLTAILGAASALRDGGDRLPTAARSDLAATVEEGARRLDRFVANLLDMTRLEAGALAAKRELVDVADAVEGALGRLSRERAGRSVRRDLPGDLPPVLADAVLLETALVNLLDNAAKHAASAVGVEARAARDRVRIAVWDDGPGVRPEDLPRLFDRFFRAAPSPDGGVGLGLSIAKGFVEAMGGAIAIESPAAQGRGARFTIELPAGAPP